MTDKYNIYKTIYLNSNKSSKKSIFSNSNNNLYNKKSNFIMKNISLIKPKSFLSPKKTKRNNLFKKQNIFQKLKFFVPQKVNNRNSKLNYNRNNIIYSPNNKSNFLRKRLILTNNSNSTSICLSRASIEQKIQKNIIKNENKILQGFKKDKIKLSNLIEKQKSEIEKLKNKNKLYNQKYLLLKKENNYLNKKIENYNNNQEQLILLIKIIQNCGIDIDKLIDDYNYSVSNYDINENNVKDESLSDSDINVESNSFIPITIENSHETKISKIKIPKLNFDIINKKKQKNKNNYKKNESN